MPHGEQRRGKRKGMHAIAERRPADRIHEEIARQRCGNWNTPDSTNVAGAGISGQMTAGCEPELLRQIGTRRCVPALGIEIRNSGRSRPWPSHDADMTTVPLGPVELQSCKRLFERLALPMR